MGDSVDFDFAHVLQPSGRDRAGFYDEELVDEIRDASTNAELWIRLGVCLVMVNPLPGDKWSSPDADGIQFLARRWTRPEFLHWVGRYLRTVRSAWDRKFWLKTPEYYGGLNGPPGRPTHRCNLVCRFAIAQREDGIGAHVTIPVVRVQPGNRAFRSAMLLYSSEDLEPHVIYSGAIHRTNFHVTANHEVGHLLGLDHPGDRLSSCLTGGETICYNADKFARMGGGDQVRISYAEPWGRAAARLTGVPANHWAPSLQPLRPVPLAGKRP